MTTAKSNTVIPEDVVFEQVNNAKWDCMMLNPLLDRAFQNVLERDLSKDKKHAHDEVIALLDASLGYSKKLLGTISHIESFEYKIRKTGGDKTMQNAEESRAGAMSGMNALRAMERNAGGNLGGMSMEAWWDMQDECVAATCNAAGNPGAFMTGFISTIAEYILTVRSSGIPNLNKWKPEATMTKEEKATHRAARIKDVEEGEKIAA
jgi:hypothetical protein